MKPVQIGEFIIDDHSPPFIIAEAGVNHESDYEMARKMIIEAREAGAHAIKFQTYEAKDLVARDSPKYWEDDRPDETQFEFFKRSSTWDRSSAIKLAEICDEIGIMFLSTGFDRESIDLLDELGMPAFKVASADITSLSLLRHIARKQKPMILSTGASTIGEIERAIEVINEEGNDQIILLHCILSYPTPKEHANLRMINSLQDIFPKYPIGFSDHIIPDGSFIVPITVTALGGKVIEKHYTLDRSMKGNDHFHSVDPPMLKNLVDYTKAAHSALGSYLKHPIDIEKAARKNARRSIAVNTDLKIGDIIKSEHLTVLRPGTGISPYLEENLIGKELKKPIQSGSLITWDHFIGD